MPNLEHIKLVEASLFIAGRPIKTDDLLTLIDGKDREELDKIIEQISKNLEERNSFIEIVKIEDEYIMRVKPAIRKELGDIETRKSLPDEFIRILAIIAMKQPIKYGDIRKIYSTKNLKESISELVRKGFIQITKEKRTKFFTTTPHFTNVFNLDPTNMKSEILKLLTKQISRRVVEPPEMVIKEEKEKDILTEVEIKEIEEKYYDLMEKLEKEREEERKRLEKEAKKKAEEAELLKNLILDPMASLFKPKKEENKDIKELNEKNSEMKKG